MQYLFLLFPKMILKNMQKYVVVGFEPHSHKKIPLRFDKTLMIHCYFHNSQREYLHEDKDLRQFHFVIHYKIGSVFMS